MNVKESTFGQLVEYLNKIEESKPRVKETAFGYDLTFETSPEKGDFVSFSNIEMLCQWATAHGYSVSMMLGRFTNEAVLTIHVSSLYGDK